MGWNLKVKGVRFFEEKGRGIVKVIREKRKVGQDEKEGKIRDGFLKEKLKMGIYSPAFQGNAKSNKCFVPGSLPWQKTFPRQSPQIPHL